MTQKLNIYFIQYYVPLGEACVADYEINCKQYYVKNTTPNL